MSSEAARAEALRAAFQIGLDNLNDGRCRSLAIFAEMDEFLRRETDRILAERPERRFQVGRFGGATCPGRLRGDRSMDPGDLWEPASRPLDLNNPTNRGPFGSRSSHPRGMGFIGYRARSAIDPYGGSRVIGSFQDGPAVGTGD
jgi:hypothetical protein